MKRLTTYIFFLLLVSNITYAEKIYSASWVLKSLLAHYNLDVGLYTLEGRLQESCNLSLEESIIKVAKESGLYLSSFYLKYQNEDIVNISEPFIASIKGVYSVVYPKGEKIEIVSSGDSQIVSKEDFVGFWDGKIISIPPTGVLLRRNRISGQKQKIVFIYSYHKESFYLFKQLFDGVYQEASAAALPLIYIDELGLIPKDSIEKVILEQELTEREAFSRARASLLSELKLIERGIGIKDPTEFYHKIYDYFAKLDLRIEMEELQYENWKAIVAFDDLNLNQLAVTLFCKGNIDRYLDVIEQYNEGFWQYNVIIRDKFFLNQIERVAEENPQNTIFTLRGLGHFGIDESVDLNKFDVEVAIIGEGSFYKLFVSDQLAQILKRNRVTISPELKESYYLRSFLIECLRNYYQNRLSFKISTATIKANEDLAVLLDSEIFRLARDVEHAIAEGRLRTTESVYDYVYTWIGRKNSKDKQSMLNVAPLLKDSQ